jgi:hypothetical protein
MIPRFRFTGISFRTGISWIKLQVVPVNRNRGIFGTGEPHYYLNGRSYLVRSKGVWNVRRLKKYEETQCLCLLSNLY